MIYKNNVTGEYKSIPEELLSVVDLLTLKSIDLIDNQGKIDKGYLSSLLPKDELTQDELDSNDLRVPYIHLKTGNKYFLKSFVVECTNGQEDIIKVLYMNENGALFVRNVSEFFNKFRKLNGD